MKKRKGITFFILLGITIFMATVIITSVQAMETEYTLAPRFVASKPVSTVIEAGQSRTVIEVKFVQGSLYRVMEDKMVTLGSDDLAGLQGILRDYPIRGIERLFTQPEEDIQTERSMLEADSSEEMPDLNLWYRFILGREGDPEAFANALNALPDVEIAYPAPLPSPPPSQRKDTAQFPGSYVTADPPTPSFVDQQGYLNPAPSGIDAKYAWTQGGGTGQNVAVVDIEYSFNQTHEDLKNVSVIGGTLWSAVYGDNHGTGVLGELIGIDNDYGVTGIAYNAAAKFSSPCMDTACKDFNPANAINTARLNTVAGDVILIEQQTDVCGLSDFGPMEWYQSVYDAIKVSTAAGRIVVEAAGNGNVNLDQAACNNLFKRYVRDSGAIIVGAGAPPDYSQKDRSRLSFSSYGSRVDLQGWGERVVTTGYGDLYSGSGKNQWYSAKFSGTSSASPVVAGAAALLSSVARQRGSVQTPAWIRSTLVNTGSPQQSAPGFPGSQKIGPRPNLKAAIARLPKATLTAFPLSLKFGHVKKDIPSGPHIITIRNSGNQGTLLTINTVTITGASAGEFTADSTACNEPLAQGKSCTISVVLTPSSYGTKTASLNIFSNDPLKTAGVSIKLAGDALP